MSLTEREQGIFDAGAASVKTPLCHPVDVTKMRAEIERKNAWMTSTRALVAKKNEELTNKTETIAIIDRDRRQVSDELCRLQEIVEGCECVVNSKLPV